MIFTSTNHLSKKLELFIPILIFFCFSGRAACQSSVYDALKANGLPMGLFPKGVKNFTLQSSGEFQVYLDQACNARFENEIHYDRNVSGNLTFGLIGGLSGISAQDLFLWFPVKEIRVGLPSSGLIYFDVGVVSKKFSLSSFETPRDCVAVQIADLDEEDAPPKNINGELQFKLEHMDSGIAVS